MQEHVALLHEQALPVPAPALDPTIVIHNEKRAGVTA
jgi:hypothetical protein